MSSIMNKVKEVLHSDNKSSQPEATQGPRNSRVSNAADPRINSDRDQHAAYGAHGAHDGSYTTDDNYGLGSDQTANRRDNYTAGSGQTSDRTDNYLVGGSQTANRTGGPASRTDGPHSSNLANKADPRVDSDRDYSHNMGANRHGTAAATTGSASRTAGTHSSSLGNRAAEPVDAYGDNSRNTGFYPTCETTSGTGTGTGTGTGSGGAFFSGGNTGNATTRGTTTHGGTSHGVTGTHASSGVAEGTHGPHSTRMANAAEPRVDSDLDSNRNRGATDAYGGTTDSSRISGAHQTSTGTYGGMTDSSHKTGTHKHTSGAQGGAAASSATTGPAPHTAGPHKSDLLNKADPRVDSDLDGSKTLGEKRTLDQSGGRTTTALDHSDAAQVPPSVLRKHIGEPTIHHSDTTHDRARRHSVSFQEQHRGL